MGGKESITSTPGPMATDREALELFMKVAVSAKPWRIDPSLTVKDWTPHVFDRPLKIAVQWWDGVVRPHPPLLRALREVSEACKKAGMTVVDWNCENLNHQKGWEIITSLYWPDGGKEVFDLLEATGEPELPLTKFIIKEQASVKNLTQPELWQVSTTLSSLLFCSGVMLLANDADIHPTSVVMSVTSTARSMPKLGTRQLKMTARRLMSSSDRLHSAPRLPTDSRDTGAIPLTGTCSTTQVLCSQSRRLIPRRTLRTRLTYPKTTTISLSTRCTAPRSTSMLLLVFSLLAEGNMTRRFWQLSRKSSEQWVDSGDMAHVCR